MQIRKSIEKNDEVDIEVCCVCFHAGDKTGKRLVNWIEYKLCSMCMVPQTCVQIKKGLYVLELGCLV